jgi:hypothetical protein
LVVVVDEEATLLALEPLPPFPFVVPPLSSKIVVLLGSIEGALLDPALVFLVVGGKVLEEEEVLAASKLGVLLLERVDRLKGACDTTGGGGKGEFERNLVARVVVWGGAIVDEEDDEVGRLRDEVEGSEGFVARLVGSVRDIQRLSTTRSLCSCRAELVK